MSARRLGRCHAPLHGVHSVITLFASQGLPGYPNNSLVNLRTSHPSPNAADICVKRTLKQRGTEPEGRAAHLWEVPTVQQAVQRRFAMSLKRSWGGPGPQSYALRHRSRRNVTNRIRGNRDQCAQSAFREIGNFPGVTTAASLGAAVALASI